MKTLLASVLGLTAMASVALAGEPTPLNLAQMDQISAGAASASVGAMISASGPNNSSATADAGLTATTVGGLSPSNTSTISATFTASAD